MQLVVRRVRSAPAQHVDVCEAAAQAVVRLLDDERSRGNGEWADAVAYWREGWIRKVVRRAENKRWEDVQVLDGVTVWAGGPDGHGAEVRAFVPGPLPEIPKDLAKLQVGGTEFPRDRGSVTVGAIVTVEVSPLVEMSTGKTAAQVGHAAQLAWEQMPEAVRGRWRADGFRIRVECPDAESWRAARRPVAVVDAGLTELGGPAETARAVWTGCGDGDRGHPM
jgi:peptidyl-tRNA hydrolase